MHNQSTKEHLCRLLRTNQWTEEDRKDFIQAMFHVFDLDRALGVFDDSLWDAAIDVIPADLRLAAATRLLGTSAETEDDGSANKQIVIYTGLRYTESGEVVPYEGSKVIDVGPEPKREEESEPDSDDDPFPPSTMPSPPSSFPLTNGEDIVTNPPGNALVGLRQAVEAMKNDLCVGSISAEAE